MSFFHLPAEDWTSEDRLVLKGGEARHCTQVRRHSVGDEVQVLDGAGRLALGKILTKNKESVEIVLRHVSHKPPQKPTLTLLQAIPKGDGMEWILEKAVELGVSQIIPVVTERTVVRLSATDADKKLIKWERQVIEACKQCGQRWKPAIQAPVSLATAIRQLAMCPVRLVASLEAEARSLEAIVTRTETEAALAIGPEGDFSPAEYLQFAAAGWRSLSLGALTLRCETAAICGVAILSYHLSPP